MASYGSWIGHKMTVLQLGKKNPLLGDGTVKSFESCAVHFKVIACINPKVFLSSKICIVSSEICTLSESDRFQRVEAVMTSERK
jgi:hypothetical protein